MPDKVYMVLYIDEQIGGGAGDANVIRELLSSSGELHCDLQPPPMDLAKFELTQDALLVDLDLRAKPPQGEPVGYYGTALAANVRMTKQECPIVLVTTPSVIGSRARQRALEESLDFDLIVYKDNILEDPHPQIARIASLIEGFQTLATEKTKNWSAIVNLMGATEDEELLLKQTAPPLEEDDANYYIPAVAHWLLGVIFRYPGIIYDELYAATRLGVSLEAFASPKVQEFLNDARYTGVFSSYRRGWWRDRLVRSAQGIMLEFDNHGYLPDNFADIFERKFGEKLERATCVVDGEPDADWICYILNEPVKQAHSVVYYPDNRPPVMDEARISFKAIKEERFDQNKVDPSSSQLIEQLVESE